MENAKSVERASYHAWFHHNEADGWITVAKKTKDGKFQQYHYRPEQLANELKNWIGEDVFFSQNTFYKPFRSIENIRQLRSLYVDLDFYLFNYDLSWVIGKLEHEFYGQSIPEPNLIIYSGQGVVLIWLLDPVPYKALPLWQAVQNYLLSELSTLGGDPKAADAARVFRLDGSINSKNGAEVRAEYRHDRRYELREIQYDYLPELTEVVEQPVKKRPGRKKKVAQLFNTYKLHHTRLMDIVKLIELRNYEVDGNRETLLFLYRYWLCCFSNDPSEALNQTVSLNLQFSNPLPIQEVERATKSAEKAWKARSNKEANEVAISKGYPGAGYNLKNTKIIDWLDITEDEQLHLKTIISAPEKRRRKRERDKYRDTLKRRERGDMTREEYLEQQKDTTKDKLFLLKKAIESYPNATQKELAQKLAVSDRYIRKLLKEL